MLSKRVGVDARRNKSAVIDSRSSTALIDSPVGPLYAKAIDGELTQLSFARRAPAITPPGAVHGASFEIIRRVQIEIGEYFDNRRKAFDVPFRLHGPPFHLRVWKALLDIPYGSTLAYGGLAKRIGEPDAARAVGAANGANPIVIIVPCHRVIGANGDLVGFGGGVERKRLLLDLESGSVALALPELQPNFGAPPAAR